MADSSRGFGTAHLQFAKGLLDELARPETFTLVLVLIKPAWTAHNSVRFTTSDWDLPRFTRLYLACRVLRSYEYSYRNQKRGGSAMNSIAPTVPET
jgi:hypothetical protein